MDIHVWIELLGAIFPTFATIIIGLLLKNNQTEIKNDVGKVHLMMNSQLTLLLETARRLARAEGVQEGRDNAVTALAEAQARADARKEATTPPPKVEPPPS